MEAAVETSTVAGVAECTSSCSFRPPVSTGTLTPRPHYQPPRLRLTSTESRRRAAARDQLPAKDAGFSPEHARLWASLPFRDFLPEFGVHSLSGASLHLPQNRATFDLLLLHCQTHSPLSSSLASRHLPEKLLNQEKKWKWILGPADRPPAGRLVHQRHAQQHRGQNAQWTRPCCPAPPQGSSSPDQERLL